MLQSELKYVVESTQTKGGLRAIYLRADAHVEVGGVSF